MRRRQGTNAFSMSVWLVYHDLPRKHERARDKRGHRGDISCACDGGGRKCQWDAGGKASGMQKERNVRRAGEVKLTTQADAGFILRNAEVASTPWQGQPCS